MSQQNDTVDAPKPTNADLVLLSLYTHACEQHEALLFLGDAVAAISAVLRDKVDGFDQAFKERLKEHRTHEPTQGVFDERMKAMQEALGVMRSHLGITT